jgi:hypothetical protein
MSANLSTSPQESGELLFYQAEDGLIANVFEEGELLPEATVAKYATVQSEGKRHIQRDIEYYNLDVIISVGYRVKSYRGTQFRIWATQRLR